MKHGFQPRNPDTNEPLFNPRESTGLSKFEDDTEPNYEALNVLCNYAQPIPDIEVLRDLASSAVKNQKLLDIGSQKISQYTSVIDLMSAIEVPSRQQTNDLKPLASNETSSDLRTNSNFRMTNSKVTNLEGKKVTLNYN